MNDEEDSVEEKQDSEPIHDVQSIKPKTVSTLSSAEAPASGDWTPETARDRFVEPQFRPLTFSDKFLSEIFDKVSYVNNKFKHS
jgi:hypothetical protein